MSISDNYSEKLKTITTEKLLLCVSATLYFFALTANSQTSSPATLVSVSGGSVGETMTNFNPTLLENGTGITIAGDTNFYANGSHGNVGAGLLLTFQTPSRAGQLGLQINAASFGLGASCIVGLSAGSNCTNYPGALALYSTGGDHNEILVSGGFDLSGNSWPAATPEGGIQTANGIWQAGNLYQFYVYGPAETWICPVGTPAGGITVYSASLSYVPAPVPVHITSIAINGKSLSITATNGVPTGPFTLVESTNLLLPLSQWTPVLTNSFDNSGNLNLTTNIIDPPNADEFYLIEQP